MGLRLRLKSTFDTSNFSGPGKVVAQGMKTYGLIVADIGSDWYFQGDSDDGWNAMDVTDTFHRRADHRFQERHRRELRRRATRHRPHIERAATERLRSLHHVAVPQPKPFPVAGSTSTGSPSMSAMLGTTVCPMQISSSRGALPKRS